MNEEQLIQSLPNLKPEEVIWEKLSLQKKLFLF